MVSLARSRIRMTRPSRAPPRAGAAIPAALRVDEPSCMTRANTRSPCMAVQVFSAGDVEVVAGRPSWFDDERESLVVEMDDAREKSAAVGRT